MSHEVELKFDLAPGDVTRVAACPSLASRPAAASRHETVYFDTPGGTLREAGYSLRIRRSGSSFRQTIKRKRGRAAGFFVRQEWEAEVAGFALDRAGLAASPLKKLLEKIAPGDLVPLIRTSIRRTAWLVAWRGCRVEVVLDEGSVASGKEKAPVTELELELKEGGPNVLFELAEEIGRAVPLRLGVLTKAERGYALAQRQLGRVAKAEPVALAAPSSEGDAFRAIAHACLRHYRLNEIVLLGGRDADALHQARIALRRLRSAFSLFRPTTRGKDYQALRDELGWLAGQLGDARNLDVLLAGEAGLPDDELLHARLIRARGKAYDRVEAALHSERTRALMLRLTLWIEIGAWRFRARAGHDLSALAEHQLDRQWRKIKRRSARLARLDPERRHGLRLDVKKLRYAAEFLAGLAEAKPLRLQRDRFIAALKDLQERLGDLGDAEAAEAMTARLAPGLGSNAERIRRHARAGDGLAAAEDALARADAAAGYWAPS